MKNQIKTRLKSAGWFQTPGLWAVVDGQFGSTGKGVASGLLGELFGSYVSLVTSNAGPNSGHTSYYEGEKIVLMQLPSFAATAWRQGHWVDVMLNAGAIIAPDRLNEELEQYLNDTSTVFVHPAAAIVTDAAKDAEKVLITQVGSTGKGTGAALAAKVMRDPNAVAEANQDLIDAAVMAINMPTDECVFMEISQGFSLSLNASGMYPYTTSRDCTITQGLSDAGVHPSFYRDCIMVVRTFPIRVAGNSGPCYPDQTELTWDELGQEPEITTVTKKVRRVFTWSCEQFEQALRANRPGVVFVNFMNYIKDVDHDVWLHENVLSVYRDVMGRDPDAILLGYGPYNEDVKLWGAL